MDAIRVNNLITDKEKLYFKLMLVVSIILYVVVFIVLLLSIVGLLYVPIIALALFIAHGLAIGNIKQNAVKITEHQFGDIYAKVVEYSQKLNLETVPDVYLMQSGGLLNAFATRFLFKDIMVIYSDVMELAYENGENAVNFIIAHELGHIKRKHLSKMLYIMLGNCIPYLGKAYSRACESTCDRIALALTDKLPLDGLLILLAGKQLYNKVDSNLFVQNAYKERDFWSWYAEIISTHPSLATRIKELSLINISQVNEGVAEKI